MTAEEEMKYDELTADEKRAIQNLSNDDNTRTFHGKAIPKPSPITESNDNLPPPLKLIFEQFCDVFPDKLPHGLPI